MNTYGSGSKEFKLRIMELHYKDNISVKILSEKFGIHAGTIYSWRDQYEKYGEDAFVGCGRQRSEDAELRKLKKENDRLKQECELLKKVAAYRAKLESKKNALLFNPKD